MDREKSEDYNDTYFMAFALKGKVLKIVKENVISSCGHCHLRNAVSHALRHEQVN